MRAPVSEQINLGQPVLFSFDWVPMTSQIQARAVNLVVSDSPDFTTNVRVFEDIRQDQFPVVCDRGKTYWWRYVQILYINRVLNYTPPPIVSPWSPVWAFRTAAVVLPNPVNPPPPPIENPPIEHPPVQLPEPKKTGTDTGGGTSSSASGPIQSGVDTKMILILGVIALLVVFGRKLL